MKVPKVLQASDEAAYESAAAWPRHPLPPLGRLGELAELRELFVPERAP